MRRAELLERLCLFQKGIVVPTILLPAVGDSRQIAILIRSLRFSWKADLPRSSHHSWGIMVGCECDFGISWVYHSFLIGTIRSQLHRRSRSLSTLQKIVPKCNRAQTLDLEECRNYTRLPLSPNRLTLLNILGVVGRNDVLARLGVVHNGLGVREEAIEAPVEDASGDEGVDVADVETAQFELLA